MAQLIADRRDIDFVLYEQLEVERLCDHDRYRDFDRKIFDMTISEARTFAIKEILPTLAEGDREGASFESGTVKVPKCYHRPYKLFAEGEWNQMTIDSELGGQGFPEIIGYAAFEYLGGANYAFTLYAVEGLTAGKMIQNFGSDTQKKIFLEKMINGTWGGTMDLTEPGAGSDVGALTTTAEKNPDGTYTITGNKIFITGGEQDLTENIIHPVLARIKGAPEGAKGISLFIVPKYWVNEDGSLGEFNDIVCTGIEKKMGISGSATCSLTFGGQGKCRGLLLGEEHKGMRVMFQMMNEARILVGSIGAISASAAYLYAVNYARDRYQGRDLEKIFETDAPQVPIIHHPDVRRMLLKMKAYVEGMRSLQYFGYYCIEKEKIGKDDKEKSYYKGLLDLLTPIMKSYCTDRGFEVCSEALQVFGGYGYTREYPVEQLLRDVRIASIYEGTNGIQAMDLLARKLPMKEGAIFLNLMGEIEKTINMARSFTVLTGLADRLKKAVDKLGLLTGHMGKTAMSADLKVAFAHASPYLETIGDVIMGWMLLWRATVAEPKLQEILEKQPGKERETIIQKNKNAAFYQGQLNSADYFIKSVLPITLGKMEAIMENCSAVVDIPEESFGG